MTTQAHRVRSALATERLDAALTAASEPIARLPRACPWCKGVCGFRRVMESVYCVYCGWSARVLGWRAYRREDE